MYFLRILLGICLCFALDKGIAQQELIDTLNQRLLHAQRSHEKIDLHLGITRLHMLVNVHDSAVHHCEIALGLAMAGNEIEQKTNALTFKCMLDYEGGVDQYASSRLALETAIRSKSKDAIAFATYVNVEFAQYDAQKDIEIVSALLDDDDHQISLKRATKDNRSTYG